jgi:hypothetical protein
LKTQITIIAIALSSSLAFGDDDAPLTWRQGDASVSLNGYTQLRYTCNWRSDPPPSAEDVTHGFSLRRTRLTTDAQVGELSFKITATFSRSDGAASQSDGSMEAPLSETTSIQIGQFKAPLLKEELTSAKRLLAADRSLTNAVFTLSRTQGVAINTEQEGWRATVMLHDGADAANVEWNASPADLGLAARAEILLVGDSLRPFREATSPRGTTPSLLLGVAADYEALDQPAAFDNIFTGTADLDFKSDGWGGMLAAIIRHQWGGPEDFTDFAFVIQGSVYLDDHDELFARTDVIFADTDRPNDDPFPSITAGYTPYILGHALKLTSDATYYPVGTTDNDLVGASSGIGLLASDEAQLVLRVQLQAIF